MRSFELYGTVDAAVCCLDSINYLCGDGDRTPCLACLYLYIAPGGLLVFDVNSPVTFEKVYGGNAYILEDTAPAADGQPSAPAVYCGWQNEYDPGTHLCRFYLSVFREEKDGRYVRTDEEQTERCFSRGELETALDRAGFDLCGIFGGFDFLPPGKAIRAGTSLPAPARPGTGTCARTDTVRKGKTEYHE